MHAAANKRVYVLVQDVELWLVDWGYNTPAQRQEALAHPHMQLISAEHMESASSEWLALLGT
jgi:hypothetical protein